MTRSKFSSVLPEILLDEDFQKIAQRLYSDVHQSIPELSAKELSKIFLHAYNLAKDEAAKAS